jgi:hypothetical protein
MSSREDMIDLDRDLEVFVDYNEPLESKVARLVERGLTFANKEITTEHFPAPKGRSGTVKMCLALPKSENAVSTEDAKQFVKQCNPEVGDPYQLLDWLNQSWDRLQEQMTQGLYIAALAVSWQSPGGGHSVVYLRCDGARRRLGLHWTSRVWGNGWRFVGSNNVPSNS